MAHTRKTKDLNCSNCGRTYRVPSHWSDDYKIHCSKACQRDAVNARRVNILKQGKTRTCRTCLKSFFSPYRSNRVYCRPLCRPSLRKNKP